MRLVTRLEKLESTKNLVLPTCRMLIVGDEPDGALWAEMRGERYIADAGENESALIDRICPPADGEMRIVNRLVRPVEQCPGKGESR